MIFNTPCLLDPAVHTRPYILKDLVDLVFFFFFFCFLFFVLVFWSHSGDKTYSLGRQKFKNFPQNDGEGDREFNWGIAPTTAYIHGVENIQMYITRISLLYVTHAETETTPAEILARGPAALEAYIEASRDGTKPVYRTRLMLVGQERVGKTSLMKNITGQR